VCVAAYGDVEATVAGNDATLFLHAAQVALDLLLADVDAAAAARDALNKSRDGPLKADGRVSLRCTSLIFRPVRCAAGRKSDRARLGAELFRGSLASTCFSPLLFPS
jgi:hypothetical protein